MMIASNIKPSIWLFCLGLLGIASTAPLISKLIALQVQQPPLPIELIQLISIVQLSALLMLMIWLGIIFSKKVALNSPAIFALSHREPAVAQLIPQLVPALIGGILGGLCLLIFFNFSVNYLPTDFLTAGKSFTPPWYTKLLYGGITEELLIRWGLMSFLVWCSYRLTQPQRSPVRPHNYIFGITLSALIFGLGHLPAAHALSPELTVPLIGYIIIGNAAFGLIAGYLYWRKGLESAILAHMICHLTMIAGDSFL